MERRKREFRNLPSTTASNKVGGTKDQQPSSQPSHSQPSAALIQGLLGGHIVYTGAHGVGKSFRLQQWQRAAISAGVPVIEVPTLSFESRVATNPHLVARTLKDIARSAVNAASVVPTRSAVLLIDDVDVLCDAETVEEAAGGLLRATVGARLVASALADTLDMLSDARRNGNNASQSSSSSSTSTHTKKKSNADEDNNEAVPEVQHVGKEAGTKADNEANHANGGGGGGVHVLVVATALSASAVPTELTRLGRFLNLSEVLPPATEASREHIIRHIITATTGRNILSLSDAERHVKANTDIDDSDSNNTNTNTTTTNNRNNLIDFKAVSDVTHGYTPADLSTVVATASANAFLRCQETSAINTEDILNAVRTVRPSAMKALEIQIPKVTWSDIGGSDEAKEALQSCVAWSLGKERSLFDALGVKPPRGVLLYGPPGCSKTMLAKALAHESGLSFISVKGPEVFSKWVGDSEKAVRDLFARARAVAPCVVFVDELDGMCGKRGAGGVSDRVISQFLTELDGLPSMSTSNNNKKNTQQQKKKKSTDIVFVAATNRPDNIDAAVLRPGRIDRKVHVGLPKRAERLAIATIGMRGLPISDDVSFDAIAEQTEGYSGAEVIAVCKEAAFQAIGESMAADFVTKQHVDEALKRVKPRLNKEEVEWYVQWATKN